MNVTEYETNTLARPDVKDIIKMEAVERDRSGNTVVHLSKTGRHVVKYDVHLMREVDGQVVFDKEHITVLDKGKATEEVEYNAPTNEPKAKTAPSQIKDYVMKHANNAQYLDKRITEMNLDAPWVRFTAVKDIGNNAGKIVNCFAYMKGATPTTIELTE